MGLPINLDLESEGMEVYQDLEAAHGLLIWYLFCDIQKNWYRVG